jgi:hypothetical protein
MNINRRQTCQPTMTSRLKDILLSSCSAPDMLSTSCAPRPSGKFSEFRLAVPDMDMPETIIASSPVLFVFSTQSGQAILST